MKIAVVGTGYVGLVSGVCLAHKGHDVTCVDTNSFIVKQLNAGIPTIHERDLPEMLTEVIKAGRFRVTDNIDEALKEAALVLVAVGTPSNGGKIDLAYIKTATTQIGRFLSRSDRFLSVIVKSTVIPGTTDSVILSELEQSSGKFLGDFGLGMNPEFLREGEAIEDFMNPDRIVFGYEDDKTLSLLDELYAPWNVEKIRVNCRTAELIKYANNALLATQISTVNEIANLSAALGGVDILDVIRGVKLDKRWNPIIGGERVNPPILSYLTPGCGFGGSCFPKDVQALRSQGISLGLPMEIMNAVLSVNDRQPAQVKDILIKQFGPLEKVSVLVLGLAFKPGTDDVRESASLKIVKDLVEDGASVTAHDPIAVEQFRATYGQEISKIKFVVDWQSEVKRVDIVVIATMWPEYEQLNFTDLNGKTVFDARRLLNPSLLVGSQYLSIGKGGKL